MASTVSSGSFVPFADDLTLGRSLPLAPEITIDEGIAAQYHAISGDRMRLPLSTPLTTAVTGEHRRLVNPGLVMQIAIGQSTVATRRVIANLFYRGVKIHQPVYVGDTLSTTVTPIAARLASSGERAKVLLRMLTTLGDGSTVIDFERVALIPVKDRQSFHEAGEIGIADRETPLHDFVPFVPASWTVEAYPSVTPTIRENVIDELREPLTDSLALVRLTGNHAAAHRDIDAGVAGRRLVYGGHVVALAQAALTRQTDPLTVIGWRSCDHLAPTFEDELLQVSIRLEDTLGLSAGAVQGYRVRASVKGSDGSSRDVLDWRPVVFTAPAS